MNRFIFSYQSPFAVRRRRRGAFYIDSFIEWKPNNMRGRTALQNEKEFSQ